MHRAVLLAALALSGCELTSTTVMEATLLQTPAAQLPDGTLDASVTASVTLETRDLTGSSATPVTGARVQVEVGGQALTLADQGNGQYTLSSQDQPLLQYLPGSAYHFTASAGGGSFSETVTAPQPELLAAFSNQVSEALILPDGTSGPSLQVLPVNPGVDLSLVRSTPAGRAPATLEVSSATVSGSSLMYSWPALDASGLEDFFEHPQTYQVADLTLPSAVWGPCGTPYMIFTFTALARGSVDGDNLSIGSLVQAGSAQMALAHCEIPSAPQT